MSLIILYTSLDITPAFSVPLSSSAPNIRHAGPKGDYSKMVIKDVRYFSMVTHTVDAHGVAKF